MIVRMDDLHLMMLIGLDTVHRIAVMVTQNIAGVPFSELCSLVEFLPQSTISHSPRIRIAFCELDFLAHAAYTSFQPEY